MEVDFIIVGQGLAGTLLSYELLRLGRSIRVYDDPKRAGASSVAAGLINPVVFHRMTKSFMVDRAFAQLEITYPALEKMLGERFYFPGQILRILNEESIRTWKDQVQQNQLQPYLEAEPDLSFRHKNIHSPFGVGHVVKAGRVDLQKLTTAFGAFLKEQQLMRREQFLFHMVKEKPGSISYKDVTAQRVIFCEGPSSSGNPWFKDLVFKHSKGELLTVEIPHILPGEILSNDIFIIPLGHHLYKIGATYRWEDLSPDITTGARQELMEKLEKSIVGPIRVIDQQAGIRPTMHDRHPVAGLHPRHPGIGILNGLGSKGALLAPWGALHLAQYLCGMIPGIMPEININRYFKRKYGN